MTLTVLHSRGVTSFSLPIPSAASQLPDPVKLAVRQLAGEFWSAQSSIMLERLASPACQAVWLDWCKLSKNGNHGPYYEPTTGQFDEALTATVTLIFSLTYAAVLRATAERQFELTTEWRLEHGHDWRAFPEPRMPLLVAPQGRALKELVHGACRAVEAAWGTPRRRSTARLISELIGCDYNVALGFARSF